MAPITSSDREREVRRHQGGHHALAHIIQPHGHAWIQPILRVPRLGRTDERVLIAREPAKHRPRNRNREPDAERERARNAPNESGAGVSTPAACGPVEDHERNGRRSEDQQVHEQVLLEPKRPASDRGRKEQQRQRPRERMRDVSAQVDHSLGLHR